jgi:hypothetical protein
MTPFITTITGLKVNPLSLQVQDINIHDIAHHLALLNRFVGASREPISIAQHSVYVSRLLRGTGWEREGLFHDAPEAYLGDVSKWVKGDPSMSPYRQFEDEAWVVICLALDLRIQGSPDLNPLVNAADKLMVRYEHYRLGHCNAHLFDIPGYPKPTIDEITLLADWKPWYWKKAKHRFLLEAKRLGFKI